MDMADRLLANPVIEDSVVTVVGAAETPAPVRNGAR
jgi:hypothetical protein